MRLRATQQCLILTLHNYNGGGGVKAPSPLEDIMRKVLLSKNPHTGKETWIEDTVDGLQVNTKVDVSPVLLSLIHI